MKKKPGPKPKADSGESRKVFAMRLTPSELTRIEAAAKNRNMKVSEYVRFVVMAAADIESMLPKKSRKKP